MLEKIVNSKLIKGNSAVGIYIFVDEDANYDINFLILEQKKSKLDIGISKTSINSIDELKEQIPNNKAVYLAVDGKGIMHKTINSSVEIDKKTALSFVLPNANIDDFIIEVNEINKEKSFVSIARKESVVEIIEKLSALGIKVQQVFLGCFTLNNSNDLVKGKNTQLITPNSTFNFSNGFINSIEKNTNIQNEIEYEIGSYTIQNGELMPFSVALTHFLDIDLEQEIPLLNENKSNYLYSKLFVISGWSILIFLFCTLLVNYLLFDYYNKKNNDLSYQVSQNVDLLAQIDTLTTQIKRKDEIAKKSGSFNSSKNSFYADRIALLLDNNIVLTDLEINPLQKKLKEDLEPDFKFENIVVKGITKQSTALNDWIHILKKEKWIKSVSLINYLNESGQSSAEFELEILMQN